jgi:acetyltransferase
MDALSRLFAPSIVAVVGATDREGSVGRTILTNLVEGFRGEVVPVNPDREEVLGIAAVDDVSDVPEADLVVVAIPADPALEVVRGCGEIGIRNLVVISAGFGEMGEAGAARERELAAIAEEYDLNVVGPNCLGVISTASGLNATFGPEFSLRGPLSFVSQSGAFVTAVLDWAKDQDVGFEHVVSLGNKTVLDETDFVREWGDDPDTDVVLGYLESIEDGRAFLEACRDVTRDTPVVVVKAGRTEAGARAAASHTGAIAGSDRAYDAGFEQGGVLRAENVQELFDYTQVLAGQPLPDGDSVAVVTNAGGPGVMSTDALGASPLSVASFTDETIDRLREILPATANVYNPVDVVGDADLERFRTAMDIVFADETVDAAIVCSAPAPIVDYDALARVVGELHEKHDLPVVTCLMGGDRTRSAAGVLNEYGIPNYFDPARAVDSLSALVEYRDVSRREYEPPKTFDVDRDRARSVLERVRSRESNRLGLEALPVLDAYGIPTPDGRLVESPAEAIAAAEDVGEPVVMKVVSPAVVHKSDVGGVAIGVSLDEVADTYDALIARVQRYQPDATVLGVYVQEQVDVEAGVETIVGMNRDPQFGPLLMFGLGGIFVEVLEDVTFRVAPVGEPEARSMLEDVEAAPLLSGARGREPVDRAAIVDVVQRLSQLVTDFPAILELDVNPLVATADSVAAIDLRLTVDPDELRSRKNVVS